jgi:hypothetical protein
MSKDKKSKQTHGIRLHISTLHRNEVTSIGLRWRMVVMGYRDKAEQRLRKTNR